MSQSVVRNSIFSAVLLVAGVLGTPVLGLPSAYAAPYTQAERKSVQTDKEAQIDEIRNQEITQLRIALGRRIPTNRRADLYLRLAEIYLEGYRAEFLIEGRIHDKRIESGHPGSRGSTIDRGLSKPYLIRGIQACQDILKLRIPFSKMDEVYYFLGFNYGELGKIRESRQAYERLVSGYPNSVFAFEGYRELGDIAFNAHDYRKAKDCYERAYQKNPKNEFVPRVLHKLSWVYYRLKQFDKAVETLKRAIAMASTDEDSEKFLSLREEGLRDIALFMSDAGRADEALEYFAKVAGNKAYYPKTLERLGAQFERNLEREKATRVYESLLKTHPDDEAAFRVRTKLYELDLKRNRAKDALNRIRRAKLFKSGENDTEIAYRNLKASVRKNATSSHEAYRKTGNKANLALAEDFYSVYLSQFLADGENPSEQQEIRMYLADVKRESGKSAEASAIYKEVLNSGDKRFAKQAGSLWTASLSEAIKKAGPSHQKQSSPSQLEKDFIDAADQMHDALGNTPEGLEASLRAAQVLAGYTKTQSDAMDRLEKIVDSSPKSAQAGIGARLWLQLLSDRKDSDLGSVAQKLAANNELMATDRAQGGKLKAMIDGFENVARVNAISDLEKEKDYEKAAQGYEEVAAKNSKREFVEKAYANAIASYNRGGDSAAAERVFGQWIKRYPDSHLFVESLRSAATFALIEGRFEQSASLFERLGRSGKDGTALETAGRLYEGLGKTTEKRKVWETFLTLYPQSPKRFELAESMAEDLSMSGSSEAQAASFYKYCMAGMGKWEARCGAKLGDLYKRAHDIPGAKRAYEVAAQFKSRDVTSPYVGYARYRLAEFTETEGRFSELRLPESELKKGLTSRLKFLEPLSRAYNRTVEAGGPWAIAALERLALWADRFALEIDGIDIDLKESGMNDAQAKAFRQGMNQVSGPLRAKARETWMQALKKANESEILSPAIPRIMDHLSTFGSIARAQGFRGHFRLAGIPADGGGEGSKAMVRIRSSLKNNARDSQAWVDYGNLLWGEGKPGLSSLAYDQALSLSQTSPAALNNRAVVLLSSHGQEEWDEAHEANQLLKLALEQDSFFLAAKMNRAAHLGYYRLFAKAKPLWEQSLQKAPIAEVQLGFAISVQGVSDLPGAEAAFKRAKSMDGWKALKSLVEYHEAAFAYGRRDTKKCRSSLDDASVSDLVGFEKDSYLQLKKDCAEKETPPDE